MSCGGIAILREANLMKAISGISLSLLSDALIDPTPDSLHGLESDGLHTLADKSLKILLDWDPRLLLKQQHERVELDLHQGERSGYSCDRFVVHVVLLVYSAVTGIPARSHSATCAESLDSRASTIPNKRKSRNSQMGICLAHYVIEEIARSHYA